MTEAEERVLEAVVLLGDDGWPVSVREVQDHLGYGSPSPVHNHLVQLERQGMLQTNPRPRATRRGGWRPTQRGIDACPQT